MSLHAFQKTGAFTSHSPKMPFTNKHGGEGVNVLRCGGTGYVNTGRYTSVRKNGLLHTTKEDRLALVMSKRTRHRTHTISF